MGGGKKKSALVHVKEGGTALAAYSAKKKASELALGWLAKGAAALTPVATTLWLHFKLAVIGYGSLLLAGLSVGLFLRRWSIERFFYRPFRLVPWSGLTRLYPVRSLRPHAQEEPHLESRDEAELALVDAVRNATEIKLLLVSGFRFIGTDRKAGKLLSAIIEREEPVRLEVLLMRSDLAATKRAKAAKLEEKDYIEGARAVLYTLGKLKRMHGISIEVRIYEEDPIWQMVIVGDEIWLQCAWDTSTDLSPVYCFTRSAKYGMAHGLEAVWQRRWTEGDVVDLDSDENKAEPDWSHVKNLTDPGLKKTG